MRTSNKRIAKNTLIVYVRLIITTIIGLLSSRFVLQALGTSDYGLYNVVGGFIMMFSFISAALSTTTRRFLNYEMGKADGDVNKVFNICHTLHILISILTLLILEIAGIWYIKNFLNVEIGKAADAMFVFQVSTIVACVGIINVPFQSLFMAKEKFFPIAVIDVLSQLLKFILILVLLLYDGNALRFYALSMTIITAFSFIAYHYLAYMKWPEIIAWKFEKKKESYKELLVFNNYNILSVASLLLRNQGSNILINYFFGTIVNAAYAISFTVQNYVNMVVGSIDTASAPQITQNISSKQTQEAIILTSKTCRICILMMILILLPLSVELNFILHLWLGENVPEGTLQMCYYAFLLTVISASSGGIMQLINAIGHLKWFTLQYMFLYILGLIAACLLFYTGLPPYMIFLVFFVADIISRFNQIYLLKKYINFDVFQFVKESFLRPIYVTVIGLLYIYIYVEVGLNAYYYRIVGIVITAFVAFLIVFYVGLLQNERIKINTFVKNKIKHYERKN